MYIIFSVVTNFNAKKYLSFRYNFKKTALDLCASKSMRC